MLDELRRQWVRIALGLVILLFFLVHAAQWQQWPFIDRLESIAYDLRLLSTMSREVDERIVIIDIDEASLARHGRWPWSREVLATMVDRLFDDYGAGLVAFDVVFAEREEASGLRVLDALESSPVGDDERFRSEAARLRPQLDHDRIFAESLTGRPVILGYFFENEDESGHAPRVGMLPRPLFPAGTFTSRRIPFISADGYGANLAGLQENAIAAGHFIAPPDADGLVRRVPMLYEFEDAYYESLALAVVRVALGVDQVAPVFPTAAGSRTGYTGMEWLQIGNRNVPVDRRVRSLVPFRGPKGSFPYISATDIIEGEADRAMLEKRIVLIGTTAKGLLDLRATPIQPNYPGVEVHANMISGMLDGTVKQNPDYTLGAEVLLLLLTGLVMAVALPLLTPLMSALATLGLLVGIVGVNFLIWIEGHFVFPLATGVLAVATLFLFNMSYGFFVESRGKRQLAGLFGEYVPPELVEEMSRDPDAISLESESRELTVLFSDVRGFTTISEGLEPQELSELMNEFLTPMTRVIHNHRGTIDKYMGDAIMAFWGAPLNDGEHARHALLAAMAMLTELRRLQPQFEERGWPPIHIGVGLNTGEMSVGNMGSAYRRAYTVLGDAVNLGARLESLTKVYGVELIVNETTKEAVPEYVYRELDRVRVKGKDTPVTIFEPLGKREDLEKAHVGELKLYRQALKLYRGQQWDMAEIQFINLEQKGTNPTLYAMYSDRIAFYREAPPGENWDGVFTHLTK